MDVYERLFRFWAWSPSVWTFMNDYERLWTFIKILVWVAMAADVYKQGCERLWTFIKPSPATPKHNTVYNIKPVKFIIVYPDSHKIVTLDGVYKHACERLWTFMNVYERLLTPGCFVVPQ